MKKKRKNSESQMKVQRFLVQQIKELNKLEDIIRTWFVSSFPSEGKGRMEEKKEDVDD